jgi:hypothetical protein
MYLVSPEGLQDALKEPSAGVPGEGGGGEEGEQGGGVDQEVGVDSQPGVLHQLTAQFTKKMRHVEAFPEKRNQIHQSLLVF